MSSPSHIAAQKPALTGLALPPFPEWVPAAVVEAAKQLSAELASEKDPDKGLEVLSRLVSDPRMKRVWGELFKKKRVNYRSTEEFVYAACVTNASQAAANRRQACELRKKGGALNERDAKLLEAEASLLEKLEDPPGDLRWTEQDRAAQLFLWHAYRTALDCEPVYLSDLRDKTNELRTLADQLGKGAATLESHGMERLAKKLIDVAEECEDEAANNDSAGDAQCDKDEASSIYSPRADDPWIITRKTRDVQLRAFVVDLSIPTSQLFGKLLYSTLANVTNVVFSRQDVTDGKVREILRTPLGRNTPNLT